jgi:hypothetical protein
MVQSVRLYVVNSTISLAELNAKLGNINLVEERKVDDETYKLRTLVQNISVKDQETLWGTLVFETLEKLPQIDGTMKFSPVAQKFDFVFIVSSFYFVPFGCQYEAETVATKMNKIIFEGELVILKLFLERDVIEKFLRLNPHTIKRCTWKDLDIPGVDKASLGGPNITRSTDHRRYEMHGVKKFIIIKLHENGWVIGLSDVGALIFYSNVSREDILKFIKGKILPLIP